jgi:hypothetical protein
MSPIFIRQLVLIGVLYIYIYIYIWVSLLIEEGHCMNYFPLIAVNTSVLVVFRHVHKSEKDKLIIN